MVLMRQHVMGRCKIADRYGPTLATVTRVPCDSHGSFTVKFPGGRLFEQHGSQLKKFYSHVKSAPSDPAGVTVRLPLCPPVHLADKKTTYTLFELVTLVSGKIPVPVRQNATAVLVARSCCWSTSLPYTSPSVW